MTSGRVSDRAHVRPHGLLDVLRAGNLGALILPLVLLGAGAAARARLARKTVAYSWRGVQVGHPAGWTVAERSADPAEGDTVVLVDLLGPGRIKPRLTMRIAPLPAGRESPDSPGSDATGTAGKPSPTGAATEAPAANEQQAGVKTEGGPETPEVAVETLSNRLPLYYVLGEQPVHIGDLAATRIDSAFAFTSHPPPGRKSPPGHKGDIPVVMRAIDVVVLPGGRDALSVQVAAPIEDFEAQRPILEAIISSLKIDPTMVEGMKPANPPADGDSEVARTDGDKGAGRVAGDDQVATKIAVPVSGQVVDAESGLAVPGAIVLFLAPGTSVENVNDDNLTQSAYTTGLVDSTGHFTSNRALGGPGHYGVMVVADGYRWIGSDDGVSLDGQTPAHLDVGVVRLRRR